MAILGSGSKVYVDDGVSNAATVFAGVTSINVPIGETSEVDSTNLDSPNNSKQTISGLKDAGTITFNQQYSGAAHARLATILGVEKNWQIFGPDENGETAAGRGKYAFAGFVKSAPLEVSAADGIPMISVTVRVNGAITVTASAALPA